MSPRRCPDVGVLDAWLSVPHTRDGFLRDVWGKVPFAVPTGARTSLEACSWTTLDGILRHESAADCLVVSRGTVSAAPAPRSLAQLRDLFAKGLGIVVREADRQSRELSGLG